MIELKLVEKLADRLKWQRRFNASYSGGLLPVTDALFGPLVKYFAAVEDKKELGFIRISDYSKQCANYPSEEVWSISDAYVKPGYRRKGVLRDMICKVVKDHNVKMLFIDTERLVKNGAYYIALGFSNIQYVDDGAMAYLSIDRTSSPQAASNDAQYSICA